jgi:lysophospholipase L1-like esterase
MSQERFSSILRRLFGIKKSAMVKKLPQIVLFGDSLTEWAFDESTAGFGWVLEKKYAGKAEIINEGMLPLFHFDCIGLLTTCTGDAGNTSTGLQRSFTHIISRATKVGAPPTLLVTIFLGANDACIMPQGEYVPLPRFESNIREFVETILVQDAMPDTKIVLITPPPINIPDPIPEDEDEDDFLGPAAAAAMKKQDPKEERGYRTYMSKKRYGEKIMEIAKSYKETGRVVGYDYWKAMVNAGLNDQNRLGDEDAYDEER